MTIISQQRANIRGRSVKLLPALDNRVILGFRLDGRIYLFPRLLTVLKLGFPFNGRRGLILLVMLGSLEQDGTRSQLH